jgi:hypothetical protein
LTPSWVKGNHTHNYQGLPGVGGLPAMTVVATQRKLTSDNAAGLYGLVAAAV